jgi:hypothetical protein
MPLFDKTDFESGLNGWQFKSWMPASRSARAEIGANFGFSQTGGVLFHAEGQSDDGIFFLEKVLNIDSKLSCVSVSWFFADFDPHIPINAWPRVVYVGPPRNLALPDTQHVFTWLTGWDRLVHMGDRRWNQQHYLHILVPGQQVQVCVGWKINWETERTNYIDNLVVMGA